MSKYPLIPLSLPAFLKLLTISAFVAPNPLMMSKIRHTVTYPRTEKAQMLGIVSGWRMEWSQASQISPASHRYMENHESCGDVDLREL